MDRSMADELILVDAEDHEIGSATKERCHSGDLLLHRAFSVFLFNDKNEMLLTQRSAEKKTWPLYWSNAVCSHPRKGETVKEAVKRRVPEELGIPCEDARFLFTFTYEARYDAVWGEREVDWVFIVRHNGPLRPDPAEITGWKYVEIEKLQRDLKANPDTFTPWFRLSVGRVIDALA